MTVDATRHEPDPRSSADAAFRDPLSAWRAERARPREDRTVIDERPPASVTMRRLARYLALHDARARGGPLPPFERDVLRQGDLRALGVGPEPSCERLDRDALASAEALWREVRERPHDEPWVERWLLHLVGFTNQPRSVPFWREVLERPSRAAREPFALERRTYALAALAMLASSQGEGPARSALIAALDHPEPDVRASAAVYLVAVHRLEGRALPLDALSPLDRIARADPALEPRHVARALLESDGVPAGVEQPGGVYALRAAGPSGARVIEVRAAQTLGHLHVAIARAEGRERDAPYAFQLSSDPHATRYAVQSDGRGRRPGELLLGELGLRAGDRFFHRVTDGSPRHVIDVLELRPWADEGVVYPRVVGERAPGPRRPWPIAVMSAPVAGTRFHQAGQVWSQLAPGEWLVLRRESSNAHDDRAIEVLTRAGAKLGYVPRTRNRALAQMMDAGEPLAARIDAVDGQQDPPLVLMDVFARGP